MARLNPSRRLRYFLLWTIATCTLLGIQKILQREDESLVSFPDVEEVAHISATPRTPQETPHPFEEGRPKMLLVLTYQRSGSTFFGSLFNENPNAFYTFEPLDGLYSHYYGTWMTWNVPSDITSYPNGSERILPRNEVDAVTQFLASLLSCDLRELPSEALLHPYIYYYRTDQYLASSEYIRCIDKYEELTKQCASRAPTKHCGYRFGMLGEARLQECHRALHDGHFRQTHKAKVEFQKYLVCMKSLKKIVDSKCLSLWKRQCDGRSLRVAKTVRATMDSVEPLLQQFPNFRLIHLVRDPRAVVLSRKLFDQSSRGLYSNVDPNKTMTREAKLLCRTMARDLRLRRELETKYPGRIQSVIYDELVRDVQRHVLGVYRFLGYPNVARSAWWKRTMAPMVSSDSVRRANKWQSQLTYEQNREIVEQCRDVFDLVQTPYWLQ